MFQLSSGDQRALTSFAQELIRIPSPSAHEEAVATRLCEEMQRVGFTDVRTDRIGNVIAHAGNGRGPTLLFNGHMDTVDVTDRKTWRHDPFAGDIDQGVLHGRGSADMKGPLASLIYGMKLLLQSGTRLDGDLYVAGVVQEEPCEGLAMRVLIEEEGLNPDIVVLCEPSDLQLATGQRGRMGMRVNVHGVAAHASMPEQGQNAIYAAARVIFGTELLASTLPSDSLMGQGSLAVTQIESFASSQNAIPDCCRFYIDRRLTLGETEARALTEIETIIKREQVRASVEVTDYEAISYTGYPCHAKEYYPAWFIPDDHALVRTATRTAEESLGYRPRLIRWRFSTDGSYTMGVAGIPTIGFGPGQHRVAHTTDEHIHLDDMYQASAFYASLAADILHR